MTRSFEAWKYSAMRSRTSKRRLDATEVEVPPLGSLLPARTRVAVLRPPLKTDCRACALAPLSRSGESRVVAFAEHMIAGMVWHGTARHGMEGGCSLVT